MPTWNNVLHLGDVFADHDSPFEQRRDEVVRRVREAEFFDPNDRVLVSFVDDLAQAGSVAEFDRHYNHLAMWADQDHTRVWLDTNPTT